MPVCLQLLAQDLADAIAQMDEKRRFNELLLFVDTCEASTMWKRIYSPRVMGMASSILGALPRSISPIGCLSDGAILCFLDGHLPFNGSLAPVI